MPCAGAAPLPLLIDEETELPKYVAKVTHKLKQLSQEESCSVFLQQPMLLTSACIRSAPSSSWEGSGERQVPCLHGNEFDEKM